MSQNPNSEPLVGGETMSGPHIPKITLSQLNRVVSDLEGRILTVLDASIADKRQCEASKSIVRQMIWQNFDKVREWYYQQAEGNGSNFPFLEAVGVDR